MRIRRRHALESGEFPKSMQEKTAMYGKGEGTGRFRLRWRRPSHGVTARGPIQVELIGGRGGGTGGGGGVEWEGWGGPPTPRGGICPQSRQADVPRAAAPPPSSGGRGAP